MMLHGGDSHWLSARISRVWVLGHREVWQHFHADGNIKHEWCPVQFTLVIDDFGAHYVSKEHLWPSSQFNVVLYHQRNSIPNGAETMKQTTQLLDYLASQEEVAITYNASDMILAAHSDASYLSEPKAHSQACGHFFLSNNAEIEIPPKMAQY